MFYGRLGRLSYVIRLCLISLFYVLGGVLVASAKDSAQMGLFQLMGMFVGSGILLFTLLWWWRTNVRRLHDMDLSGWWFLLVCFFPVVQIVLCFWPGVPTINRFGPAIR